MASRGKNSKNDNILNGLLDVAVLLSHDEIS